VIDRRSLRILYLWTIGHAAFSRAIEVMNELEAFHRFLGDRLANGDSGLAPEECVELWRATNSIGDDIHADVVAIKNALVDLKRGDNGLALKDFLTDLRGRNSPFPNSPRSYLPGNLHGQG
jgi:hypothetical protein